MDSAAPFKVKMEGLNSLSLTTEDNNLNEFG